MEIMTQESVPIQKGRFIVSAVLSYPLKNRHNVSFTSTIESKEFIIEPLEHDHEHYRKNINDFLKVKAMLLLNSNEPEENDLSKYDLLTMKVYPRKLHKEMSASKKTWDIIKF